MPQQDQINYFPDCWNDDEKMESLFTDFRNRDLNPQGWDDKLQFWKSTILNWCYKTKTLTFGIEDLKRAFYRNGYTPLCFETVLNHMTKTGDIQPLNNFNLFYSSESWISWGFNLFVKWPLSWSWNIVKNSITKSSQFPEVNTKYIATSLLKEMAASLFHSHQTCIEEDWTLCLVEMDKLWNECASIFASREDFITVLYYLQYYGKIKVYDHNNLKIVKFPSDHMKLSYSITPIDQSILELKRVSAIVEREISELEEKIEKYKQETLNLLRNGNRIKALQVLKKKKQAEKILKKKEDTLDNMHNLDYVLKNSHSEKMIIDALQSGSSALKAMLSGDLKPERCDSMMADIEETMEQHQEVNAMISTPIGFTTPASVSDEALEQELNSLLSDGTSTSFLPSLPVPPSTRLEPTRISSEDQAQTMSGKVPLLS